MGFNNGYDAGWEDAIARVRAGQVPGLGPVDTRQAADAAGSMSLLEMLDVLRQKADIEFFDALTADNVASAYIAVRGLQDAVEAKAAELNISLTGE